MRGGHVAPQSEKVAKVPTQVLQRRRRWHVFGVARKRQRVHFRLGDILRFVCNVEHDCFALAPLRQERCYPLQILKHVARVNDHVDLCDSPTWLVSLPVLVVVHNLRVASILHRPPLQTFFEVVDWVCLVLHDWRFFTGSRTVEPSKFQQLLLQLVDRHFLVWRDGVKN